MTNVEIVAEVIRRSGFPGSPIAQDALARKIVAALPAAQPLTDEMINVEAERVYPRGVQADGVSHDYRDAQIFAQGAFWARDHAASAPAGDLREKIATDAFMQAALELDGRPFPNFGVRTHDDVMLLSGAQLFRAAVLAVLALTPE